MNINDSETYYDILDITTSASSAEVREAYIRTKTTYNRDSVALYTLISAEEREEALRKVEEAYSVLSNPDKRKEYDELFGVLDSGSPESTTESTPPQAPVVSIDRVPPMDTLDSNEQLLIPPTTDFKETGITQNVPPSMMGHSPEPYANRMKPSHLPQPSRVNPILLQAIELETEWSGNFLKKVREANKLSLEEVAGLTKITKNYLVAIEEENYAKLPAPVYVRGFVSQMAKILKLPHDKVANAYVLRYERMKFNQAK